MIVTGEEPKYWGRNLSDWHFVHHNERTQASAGETTSQYTWRNSQFLPHREHSASPWQRTISQYC